MNIRRYIIILFLSLVNTFAFSQKTNENYLFDSFQDATITFLAGGITNAKMNYNIVYGQMLYVNNGNLLALSEHDIASISKVTIGERTFIPFEKGICELISIEPYIVAEYSSIVKPEKMNIGMGATTSTTAVSKVSDLISGPGRIYELNKLTIPEADLRITYYIKKNGNVKKVSNLKQLNKLFRDKETVIDEYISLNDDFNFKNAAEFEKLILLINSEQ